MNKPKNQGTANETRRVAYHRSQGILAGRIAEGGGTDLGDVWLIAHPDADPFNIGWIEECKARANLNPHRTLASAIRKSGTPRTVLSHKRLIDKGGKRRGPDGMVETVTMHPFTFAVLLGAYEELRYQDPGTIRRLWQETA